MKDKFIAIGYHGTDQIHTDKILDGIDFSLNKGDKFLGQGFYLWRDSYDRALRWAKKTKSYAEIDVISILIECNKNDILNFTSTAWNNEEQLIEMYKTHFSHFSFGEFLDYLLIDRQVMINAVIMIDLSHNIKIFNIKDGANETNFAHGDIQICLKNNHPVTKIKVA